jgi:hypothetical protein
VFSENSELKIELFTAKNGTTLLKEVIMFDIESNSNKQNQTTL